MIGTLRWNLILATLGLLLTFLFSATQNPWLTTLIRSLYCFAILFVAAFVIRWILGTVVGLKQFHLDYANSKQEQDEAKGQHLDLVTPEDNELPMMDAQGQEGGSVDQDEAAAADFSPLNPPKLATKKVDTEDVVKAVRHLTNDEK